VQRGSHLVGGAAGQVPRQQVRNAVDGMVGDACQDIAQVCLRSSPFQFGRADQAVHRGGALAAGIGACEQVILTAKCDGAQRASAALLSISKRPSSEKAHERTPAR